MRKKASLLNNILELFVLGGFLPSTNTAYRTFGLDQESAISLVGNNVNEFDAALSRLLTDLPTASETLSRERLVQELLPMIREKKREGSKFSETEYQQFSNRILGIPVTQYRVLRSLLGVTVPQPGTLARIGDFTIRSAEELLAELPRTRGLSQSQALMVEKWSGLLIECVVEARDTTRAKELADMFFDRFELIIRVMIGQRTHRFEVGVINYAGPQLRKQIVIGETELSEVSAWQGALEPVEISNPFFTSPSPSMAMLLGLIRTQSNQLERHVIRSAEWIGQALGDSNPASGLVKSAIALEVLFSPQERGVVTPSIMAQIAESCAFILGDSPSNAAEIEREVKRLYGVRSAVVHSGKDSVELADLHSFIRISRHVVLTILSKEEFRTLESTERLAECLKRKKYAGLQ